MKKKLFIFLIIIPGIFACVQKSDNTGEQTATDSVTIITEVPSRQPQVQWAGEYAGIFPCGDCEGIEITIALKEDSTYIQKSTYLGKGNSFEENGTFTLEEPGSRIVLKSADSEQAYLLGNGTLTLLNSDGKVTEGELAEAYVLKKKE